MSARNYTNTATPAALTGSITAADTVFSLSSFAGYPAAPFTAAIERGTAFEEIVLVTAVSGTTVTATRGYDGTTAKTHPAGGGFLHVVVAKDYAEANAHVSATTGVHGLGVGSAPVGTTDTQTLSNKTLTNPVLSGAATGGSLTLSGDLSAAGVALSALNTTVGSQGTAITANTSAIGTLNTTVAAKADKTYVDSADATTLASGKSYADTKDAATLASAKAYTDAKDTLPTWTTITPGSGWSAVATHPWQYGKTTDGRVQMRGWLTNSGGFAKPSGILATLPAGIRPTDTLVIPIVCNVDAAQYTAALVIQPTGNATIDFFAGTAPAGSIFYPVVSYLGEQ